MFADNATSLLQSRWGASNIGGFQDFSIQAHDGGHVSTGPTMGDQNVSSYDPVFWFYHCNIDRLWLQWQQNVHARTLAGFKSTIDGDTSWLTDPPFNSLTGFPAATADQTISFGISYDSVGEEAVLENKVGSIAAARAFPLSQAGNPTIKAWLLLDDE